MGFISPQRAGSGLETGLPQTDAQPGAGDLQRTNGHADQLGNFPSALASFYQIFDLLYSLWGKLELPPTSYDLGAKLRDLIHFWTLCAFFCRRNPRAGLVTLRQTFVFRCQRGAADIAVRM